MTVKPDCASSPPPSSSSSSALPKPRSQHHIIYFYSLILQTNSADTTWFNTNTRLLSLFLPLYLFKLSQQRHDVFVMIGRSQVLRRLSILKEKNKKSQFFSKHHISSGSSSAPPRKFVFWSFIMKKELEHKKELPDTSVK